MKKIAPRYDYFHEHVRTRFSEYCDLFNEFYRKCEKFVLVRKALAFKNTDS